MTSNQINYWRTENERAQTEETKRHNQFQEALDKFVQTKKLDQKDKDQILSYYLNAGGNVAKQLPEAFIKEFGWNDKEKQYGESWQWGQVLESLWNHLTGGNTGNIVGQVAKSLF